MKLYLVQHAKAVSKEVDPQRPLTEEGLRDLQKIASFIKPLNLSIDYLWHSQKKRAIQTADILAEVIEIKQSRTERSDLGPNDDVARLTNEIGSLEHDIMIVGHLPFLSKLASLLLAGSESANTVAFRQGGIVCLSRAEQEQWQIEWMITPELGV
ncbi:MAG: phosphohistidine phosphatase SixA [Planctomycetota bacterium]|jgi:phosphohistidine phosphatase